MQCFFSEDVISAQGLVPLRWDCAREPKGTGEGPKPHAHDSALELSSGEAQSVRRFLNTNGLGSPIFPSGCEGKLGVALESLQGRRDLT